MKRKIEDIDTPTTDSNPKFFKAAKVDPFPYVKPCKARQVTQWLDLDLSAIYRLGNPGR